MRATLSTLVSLIAGMAAALQASAAEVTTFSLDNELEVVVLEDHRAPVVVHMLWYKAGAADEPIGKSGISHFLEHLMFKGTDEMDVGEFSATVGANGGTDNAFTSQDYTAYFQRVAADRLELMMTMEADRMQDLAFTDLDMRTERDVVLEERKQRTDSAPGALFREQLQSAQYLNHPYGVPIIGWRHEIVDLETEDAFDFYKRHYAPNNAVLIVAGDVTPEEVRSFAEATYGKIPANPDIGPRVRPSEPPQLSERRLVMADPRVAQPYVTRTYLAPERNAGDQREAAALTLLASLLGGDSATSFLGRKLQFESSKAVYTSAFYSGRSLDDTTFGLAIVPSSGVSLEEAEAALDEAVAAFMKSEIDLDQLNRIKRQIRASEIYARDDVGSLARTYGAALTSGLTVQDVQDWPNILQSVSPEEIKAAAARVFDRSNAVTGWLTGATEEVSQ
ncbi:MAG: pitrilysin family protein [Pseudomonadota bacterium]